VDNFACGIKTTVVVKIQQPWTMQKTDLEVRKVKGE